MSRLRKMMAWLAASFVVAGATFGGGSPAQAAGWTDCPATPNNGSGFVCLWEGPYYTGARWQAEKTTLWNGTSGGVSGCYNLNGSSYTNGNPVRDTSSSWAIRSSDPDYHGSGYIVVFYEWINCNTAGNYRTYAPNQNYAVSDLSTLTPSWDNTVASIKIIGA